MYQGVYEMNIIFFSAKSYDKEYFERSNQTPQHAIRYVESALTLQTLKLIDGQQVVCVFVNDKLDRQLISGLAQAGIKLIALRCAGFNNVDIGAAREFSIQVVRVPAYSPHAVAEHALALMFSLNRHIHQAYNRVSNANFALQGLLGFDFSGRTMGIIGTGKTGKEVAKITSAMGMTVLAYDPLPNPECEKIGVNYIALDQLFAGSDVISVHCPLNSGTHYLIDGPALQKMQTGVMLINTSRGAILDTHAVINALKSGKIGYLGLDVYEHESTLFFEDHSSEVIQDDVFTQLQTFPNVLITGHQGFFTRDALSNIADITLDSISQFEQANTLANEVTLAQ